MIPLTVAVFPTDQFLHHRCLLEGLSQVYPVQFQPAAHLSELGAPAVLFDVTRSHAVEACRSGAPTLAFIKCDGSRRGESLREVRFSNDSYLPQILRGKGLSTTASNLLALREEPGDRVLARQGEASVWIHREVEGFGLDITSLELPRAEGREHLSANFLRLRWPQFLPILHFLRELSAKEGWTCPPLRACFIFDDPNLHWPSYGYVDYATLARDAEANNYHAAFATVPADGWYVNPRAAAIFRGQRARLSLVVHGNDHTKKELAQPRPEQTCRALAAQSMMRVARLEKTSGVEVSRIVAPPHHACSDAMAAALLQVGFEAVCVSRGPMLAYNLEQPWPVTVGMNITEFLGGGLPIIPRFGVWAGWETEILMAVFFGQAIIPARHHQDLAGGLDFLRHVASEINRTGQVEWMDLKSIARSNFCTRRENELLRVRMYARRIAVPVPQGVTHLSIERPWVPAGTAEKLKHAARLERTVSTIDHYAGDPIPVKAGDEMDIHSLCPVAVDYQSVVLPRRSWFALGRRFLCEARDRLAPFTPGLMTAKTRLTQKPRPGQTIGITPTAGPGT